MPGRLTLLRSVLRGSAWGQWRIAGVQGGNLLAHRVVGVADPHDLQRIIHHRSTHHCIYGVIIVLLVHIYIYYYTLYTTICAWMTHSSDTEIDRPRLLLLACIHLSALLASHLPRRTSACSRPARLPPLHHTHDKNLNTIQNSTIY